MNISGMKKLYKRATALALAVALAIGSFLGSEGLQGTVSRAATPASGTLGGVDWSLSSDGTLTIGKSGETQTFAAGTSFYSTLGWKNEISNIKKVVFAGNVNLDASGVSLERMFYDCYNLTVIENLEKLDTTHATSFDHMFSDCKKLKSINVSKFDSSSVTSMASMFVNCSSLTSLDVSNFNTSNVTKLGYMFSGCTGLNSLDLSKFNTSKVKNFQGLIYKCDKIQTLNIENFDTSSATDMSGMFYNCSSLTSLSVGNRFNTSKVTNFSSMFGGCTNLTSINFLQKFDTSKATNMGSMFSECNALTTLELSSFDTSNVTNMSNMFNGCSNLEKINVAGGFKTTTVTSSDNMFAGCTKLKGGQSTAYDGAHIDASYAVVDRGDKRPGYLTYPNEPTYTITWKSQDGSSTLKADSGIYEGLKPNYDGAAPTKASDSDYTYTFSGWATETNQETGTAVDNLPAITDNTTYYAAFSKTSRIKHTVTFNTCDGWSPAPSPVKVNDGETVTRPDLENLNYLYVRWYDNSEFTDPEWSFGEGGSAVTSDVTLYAKWEIIPASTNQNVGGLYYINVNKYDENGNKLWGNTGIMMYVDQATYIISIKKTIENQKNIQISDQILTLKDRDIELNDYKKLGDLNIQNGATLVVTLKSETATPSPSPTPDSSTPGSSTPSVSTPIPPAPTTSPDASPGVAPTSAPSASPVVEEYVSPVSTSDKTIQVEAVIIDGSAIISEIDKEKLNDIVKQLETKNSSNPESSSPTSAVQIDLSKSDQDVTAVEITKTTVDNLVDAVDSSESLDEVEIILTKTSITLDKEALEAVSVQASGTSIRLVVDDTEVQGLLPAQQTSLKQYKEATTFEAYFESGGVRIHDFRGGSATVAVAFSPQKNRDMRYYHMYYVAPDGALSKYPTRYIAGKLVFVTTHFSDYAIIYDESEVNDTGMDSDPNSGIVADNWNADIVEDFIGDDITVTVNGKSPYANGLAINSGLKVSQTKSKITVKWGKVSGATGYEVFVQYCGKKFSKTPAKTVKNPSVTSITIKKINGKKLNLKKNFKIYIIAYKTIKLTNSAGKTTSVRKKLGRTVAAHIVGRKNKGYSNPKKLTVKKTSYTIKEGKTAKIHPKVTLVDPSKKSLSDNHAAKFRYASSDKSVATISKKGTIEAVGTGKCTIYVYAKNGYAKTVTVTVRAK